VLRAVGHVLEVSLGAAQRAGGAGEGVLPEVVGGELGGNPCRPATISALDVACVRALARVDAGVRTRRPEGSLREFDQLVGAEALDAVGTDVQVVRLLPGPAPERDASLFHHIFQS
jgi:hypothetical protein